MKRMVSLRCGCGSEDCHLVVEVTSRQRRLLEDDGRLKAISRACRHHWPAGSEFVSGHRGWRKIRFPESTARSNGRLGLAFNRPIISEPDSFFGWDSRRGFSRRAGDASFRKKSFVN